MQASKESCSRTRLIVQIIDSRNQAIALKTLNERYRDFSPTIHWIFVLLPNVISNSLVHCLGHERAYRIRSFLQSQQWLYATHWNTVTIRSSSYSHFLVFLALFTASCKVRGRSGWSNWYGQVLQWQGGGQVGERNPALCLSRSSSQ